MAAPHPSDGTDNFPSRPVNDLGAHHKSALGILRAIFDAEEVNLLERERTEAVMRFVYRLLREPDVGGAPNEVRYALADNGKVVEFPGALVREDRLLDEPDLGSAIQIEESLEFLACWELIHSGLFKPDEALGKTLHAAHEHQERFRKTGSFTLPALAAGALLTGRDTRAAMLLYQVRYWGKRRKHRYGRRRWIVKLAQEWCYETGLTMNQFKGAKTCLVERGLIATEVHRSDYHRGLTATFVRPVHFVALPMALPEIDGGVPG